MDKAWAERLAVDVQKRLVEKEERRKSAEEENAIIVSGMDPLWLEVKTKVKEAVDLLNTAIGQGATVAMRSPNLDLLQLYVRSDQVAFFSFDRNKRQLSVSNVARGTLDMKVVNGRAAWYSNESGVVTSERVAVMAVEIVAAEI